jgi:hypothetical protein
MSFSPSNGNPFAHLGKAHAVAMDTRAPDDEVGAANAELAGMYGHAMADQIPGLPEMLGQLAGLSRSEHNAAGLIMKAGEGGALDPKARTEPWQTDFGHGFFKWTQRRGVSFPVLKAFSRRIEVWAAIMRTRKRQVARFATPSKLVDSAGWRITTSEEDQEIGDGLKDQIRWATKVLRCGGREFDPIERVELERQDFRNLLGKLVQDTLELDNVPLETVGLQIGSGLDCFFIRDGSCFYLGNPRHKEIVQESGRRAIAYQVSPGMEEIAFSADQLAMFIRNDSAWIEENGYGYSEFEQGLDTLNGIIQALTFTKQGMNESSVPRGLLMAYGNFDRQTQEALKTAWALKVRGVQNRFSSPILFSRGQQGALQYLNTGQPFDEMGFARWITLCMAIMGGITGIDPSEVGFESFSAKSSTMQGENTADRAALSKDKGLVPLMHEIGDFLSERVIYRLDKRLRLEFTGLSEDSADARREMKLKTMTINEVRASLDMGPHPLGWFGELPYDPGMQAAEIQRLSLTTSFNEARKMWGGMEAFPDPLVGSAPLNPSMGTVYQQALMAPVDETAGGPGESVGNAFEAEWKNPEDAPAGELRSQVAGTLGNLKPQTGDGAGPDMGADLGAPAPAAIGAQEG